MNPGMFEGLFRDVYHYNWDSRDHVNLYSQSPPRAADWALSLKAHPKSLRNCLIFPFPGDLSDEQLNIRSEQNQFVRRRTKRRFKSALGRSGADMRKSQTRANPGQRNVVHELNLYQKSQTDPGRVDLTDPKFVAEIPSSMELKELPLHVFNFGEAPEGIPSFQTHLSFRSRDPENLFGVGLGTSLICTKNAFSEKQREKINGKIWKAFLNSDVTYNNRFTSWERDQLDSLRQGGSDFLRGLVAVLNRGLTLKPERRLKSSEMKNVTASIFPNQVATAKALLLEKQRVFEMKSFNTWKDMKKQLRLDEEAQAVLQRCNCHTMFKKFAVSLKRKRKSVESQKQFYSDESVNESTKQIRKNIRGNLQVQTPSQTSLLRLPEGTPRSRRNIPPGRCYMPKINGDEYYSFRNSEANVSGSLAGWGRFRHSIVSAEISQQPSRTEFVSQQPSIADLVAGQSHEAKMQSYGAERWE